METVVVEAESTELVIEAATGTSPGPGTTVAPELSAEEPVDPHPEVSIDVVVCEAVIEEVAPLHSAPMPATGSSSRGGLELLDDDLIDPTFVSLSMEPWRQMNN
jgi:hypothetical protein